MDRTGHGISKQEKLVYLGAYSTGILPVNLKKYSFLLKRSTRPGSIVKTDKMMFIQCTEWKICNCKTIP
jgi:hypothetical protein